MQLLTQICRGLTRFKKYIDSLRVKYYLLPGSRNTIIPTAGDFFTLQDSLPAYKSCCVSVPSVP